MTLLEYRIFHTVTQQGSFARAAQILHLTPSAISHAVSSMEESCGFSLFVRGKGGVSLTRSGEALYPVIRQVLSADEALTQTVGELKGVQRGKVRIGAFNSVCVAWRGCRSSWRNTARNTPAWKLKLIRAPTTT